MICRRAACLSLDTAVVHALRPVLPKTIVPCMRAALQHDLWLPWTRCVHYSGRPQLSPRSHQQLPEHQTLSLCSL